MSIVMVKVSIVLVRHLAWGWQPFVFTKFKARFGVWCFISYIFSFFACLACTRRQLYMMGQIESQKNIEIMRHCCLQAIKLSVVF